MAKGEQTRQRIIEQSAPVFNVHGYSGTSMSALTRATGLEKGGLYNHFPSKEALAHAAFDYAISVVTQRFAQALEGQIGALDRLLAIVGVFATYTVKPPLAGGCPILNTAIEADDTDPLLRARAQAAMTELQKLIGATVKAGVRNGELRPTADPRAVAMLITATLEGALMLVRLYDDPAPMGHAVAHLTWFLREQLAAGGAQ